MKKIFFNNDGALTINETIMSQPSFKKIMEDGIVTKEEVEQQGKLVYNLFRQIEETFNDDQKKLIQSVIVESNVLNTIYRYYQMSML